MSRIALTILICVWASAVHGQALERWRWTFDGHLQASGCDLLWYERKCPVQPTMEPVLAGARPEYQKAGRRSFSARIGSTGGYMAQLEQNNRDGYGFAWMGFVWIDRMTGAAQSIVWHEGYDAVARRKIAGFSVAVNTDGKLQVSIGRNNTWTARLYGTKPLGLRAWHHVAFVWDTNTYYLLVDGIVQDSLVSSVAPDSSANVPVTVGSYYASGNPRYVLDGAVDELKFVKFAPGTFYPSTSPRGNFVLTERGLAFRQLVLDDLVRYGIISAADGSLFDTPTLEATSILRAWVNSFYTNSRRTLPLDPLVSAAEDYVYPIDGTSGGPSLYLRLRDGEVTGYCGSAAITLRAVYKAFGYVARGSDWMNADDMSYTDSHSITEVWLADVGTYVVQDPTYNLSGYDIVTAEYRTAIDLHDLSTSSPSVLPFDNRGYDFNSDPIWARPSAQAYFSYFHTPATILNGWSP